MPRSRSGTGATPPGERTRDARRALPLHSPRTRPLPHPGTHLATAPRRPPAPVRRAGGRTRGCRDRTRDRLRGHSSRLGELGDHRPRASRGARRERRGPGGRRLGRGQHSLAQARGSAGAGARDPGDRLRRPRGRRRAAPRRRTGDGGHTASGGRGRGQSGGSPAPADDGRVRRGTPPDSSAGRAAAGSGGSADQRAHRAGVLAGGVRRPRALFI